MTEANPVQEELQAFRRDVSTIDAAMHRRVEEDGVRVAHLVEEAKNTPTDNEARLANENQSLKEQLAAVQVERDSLKTQLNEIATGIKEERFNLRKALEKHGIKLAVVALLIGVGVLVYSYPQSWGGHTPTQVATLSSTPTQETATPGFQYSLTQS